MAEVLHSRYGGGEETDLQQLTVAMTRAAQHPSARIMRLTWSQGHRFQVFRDNDEMRVIGHQTVALDTEAMIFAVFGEQAQVEPAIGVVADNLLASFPRRVMWRGTATATMPVMRGASRVPMAGLRRQY